MDCYSTIRSSIPGEDCVKTEFHVLHKGQSLSDLVIDGTLNTTNQQPTNKFDTTVSTREQPELYICHTIPLTYGNITPVSESYLNSLAENR